MLPLIRMKSPGSLVKLLFMRFSFQFLDMALVEALRGVHYRDFKVTLFLSQHLLLVQLDVPWVANQAFFLDRGRFLDLGRILMQEKGYIRRLILLADWKRCRQDRSVYYCVIMLRVVWI